jgi:hypothetical protein
MGPLLFAAIKTAFNRPSYYAAVWRQTLMPRLYASLGWAPLSHLSLTHASGLALFSSSFASCLELMPHQHFNLVTDIFATTLLFWMPGTLLAKHLARLMTSLWLLFLFGQHHCLIPWSSPPPPPSPSRQCLNTVASAFDTSPSS